MRSSRGTHLDAPAEESLADICGWPMFDRVTAALHDSSVETAHAITSSHTPNTRDRAADLGLGPIETPGDGYVSGLGFALAHISRPVVTVVSDFPLVVPEHVDAIVSTVDGGAATVCVPVGLKYDLGANIDDVLVFDHEGTAVCSTGPGVVGLAAADATIDTDVDTDTHSTIHLPTGTRLTLNVSRSTDIELAEDQCE